MSSSQAIQNPQQNFFNREERVLFACFKSVMRRNKELHLQGVSMKCFLSDIEWARTFICPDVLDLAEQLKNYCRFVCCYDVLAQIYFLL